MNSGFPETIFYFLLAMIPLWFVLLGMMWLRLVRRHLRRYEAMGRPRFLNPTGGVATVRFMVLRKHRLVGDPVLGLISDGALAVLVLLGLGSLLLAAVLLVR